MVHRDEVRMMQIRGLDRLQQAQGFLMLTAELVRTRTRMSEWTASFVSHHEWFVLDQILPYFIEGDWAAQQFMLANREAES